MSARVITPVKPTCALGAVVVGHDAIVLLVLQRDCIVAMPAIRPLQPSPLDALIDSKNEKVYHLVGKPLISALLGPGAKNEGSDGALRKENQEGGRRRCLMGSYCVAGEGTHRDHEILDVHSRLNLEPGTMHHFRAIHNSAG